jgi:hypothetical protein
VLIQPLDQRLADASSPPFRRDVQLGDDAVAEVDYGQTIPFVAGLDAAAGEATTRPSSSATRTIPSGPDASSSIWRVNSDPYPGYRRHRPRGSMAAISSPKSSIIRSTWARSASLEARSSTVGRVAPLAPSKGVSSTREQYVHLSDLG